MYCLQCQPGPSVATQTKGQPEQTPEDTQKGCWSGRVGVSNGVQRWGAPGSQQRVQWDRDELCNELQAQSQLGWGVWAEIPLPSRPRRGNAALLLAADHSQTHLSADSFETCLQSAPCLSSIKLPRGWHPAIAINYFLTWSVDFYAKDLSSFDELLKCPYNGTWLHFNGQYLSVCHCVCNFLF